MLSLWGGGPPSQSQNTAILYGIIQDIRHQRVIFSNKQETSFLRAHIWLRAEQIGASLRFFQHPMYRSTTQLSTNLKFLYAILWITQSYIFRDNLTPNCTGCFKHLLLDPLHFMSHTQGWTRHRIPQKEHIISTISGFASAFSSW